MKQKIEPLRTGVCSEKPDENKIADTGKTADPGREINGPRSRISRVDATARDKAVPDATLLNHIESKINEQLVKILDLSENSMPGDASFSDLGITSIQSVDLVETINAALEIDLGVETIFDCMGVKALARHIAAHYDAAAPIMPETGDVKAIDHRTVSREISTSAKGNVEKTGPAREEPDTHGETKGRDPGESNGSDSEIAIIGISGRFAGARTVGDFWNLLEEGRCSIREIDRNGWDLSEFYDPDPSASNKSVSKWGGLLDDPDMFDAGFFNISPDEAGMMDPQQRLMLEESLGAFRDAGCPSESLSGKKVGVFAGVRSSEYTRGAAAKEMTDPGIFLGNEASVLAGRISYFLNLKGPCMAIDSACSSSLVAIHMACESIRRGESDMALAGGVFVMAGPRYLVMSSRLNLLSPRGKCGTFDKNADGLVLGEGVGAIVLKPLGDAIRDRDHVYGVIKGSAVGQDGRTNGITAPSAASQARLAREVFERSGVAPETLGYIEAHGTGTALGDRVEIKGLTEAVRAYTEKKRFCAIGAHKPNVGHTVNASGMAGILKMLMAMKHRRIPPVIGVSDPIEALDGNSPVYLNTEPRDWKCDNGALRRAGVVSLGFSGANSFVILEEAPPLAGGSGRRSAPLHLFPLSARTESALEIRLIDLLNWLEQEGDAHAPDDIAYTLQARGTHYPIRAALVARDVDDLREQLREARENRSAGGGDFVKNLNISLFRAAGASGEPGVRPPDSARESDAPTSDFMTHEGHGKKQRMRAGMYCMGHDFDWEEMNRNRDCRCISMPTHPFERERFSLPEAGRAGPGVHTISRPVTEPSVFESVTDRIGKSLDLPGDLPEFQQAVSALNKFCGLLLLRSFQAMGAFRRGGEQTDKDRLQKQLGIIPGYSRLYDSMLDILASAGFVHLRGRDVLSSPGVAAETLQAELNDLDGKKRRLITSHPGIKHHADLLWTCMSRFSDILTGDVSATEIMFPHSSMELVGNIYKGNPMFDHCNNQIALGIQSYIEARLERIEKGDKINILETGAGTGGVSASVFEAIREYGDNLRYFYTDISLEFKQYGKKTFGLKYPFVEFGDLDIEKNIREQGRRPGEFDVVIAANVLHATRNLGGALKNVRTLLKPGGWLLLSEMTEAQEYLSLTFGWLDGWWLFEDEEMRLAKCPLLGAGMWENLLKREGFDQAVALDGKEFSQHVILARTGDAPEIDKEKQDAKIAVGSLSRQPIIGREEMGASIREKYTGADGNISKQPVVRPVIAQGETARRIRESIAEIINDSLEIDLRKNDMEKPFSEYGIDSILVVRLIEEINNKFSISLKTTLVFDYTNVKDLSAYIYDNFCEIIRSAPETALRIGPETGPETAPETGPETGHETGPETAPESGSETVPGADKDGEENRVKTDCRPGESKPGPGVRSYSDIAIIGMACRLPGADNVAEYWENLELGKCSVTETPKERWDNSTYYDPDPDSLKKTHCKWGGFLNHIDEFDPMFFRISGKEAELSDPQQRLFLEETWNALEDAGYAAETISNTKCGVFVGAGEGDYQIRMRENGIEREAQSFWGNDASIIPARASYILNLKGPGMTVNTACSSSLLSIHLACRSIMSGESDMAIAGGVFVCTTPNFHILTSNCGMLSPDGKCKTFDKSADGFVPGEGVGAVILKSLESALEDGDHIYGVIKGSGINQDGATNGITAPSVLSQEKLELSVYEKSGVDPSTITFVEAHGTGTKIGDPVEIEALTNAFGKYTDKKQYCAIGSVKTNIGHTAFAAGVAGLIKILLALKHKKIPPSLNFKTPNEHIDFQNSPFYVVTDLTDWKPGENEMRRAAISSFGFSGSNAHLVIEEAPARREAPGTYPPCHLIPLSAKSEPALKQKAGDLLNWLDKEGGASQIGNIAYTLAAGRFHFPVRAALVVGDIHELKHKLGSLRDAPRPETPEQKGCGASGPHSHAERGSGEMERGSGGDDSVGYREKLEELADSYSRGYEPDWNDIYKDKRLHRISLPTYPFSRSRYWIKESGQADASGRKTELPEVMHYRSAWEKSDIGPETSGKKPFGNILLFDISDDARFKKAPG